MCRIFYGRRIFYGSRNFYHRKVHNLSYMLHMYGFFISHVDQKLSTFEIQKSFDSLVFFGFITCILTFFSVFFDENTVLGYKKGSKRSYANFEIFFWKVGHLGCKTHHLPCVYDIWFKSYKGFYTSVL